MLSTTGRRRAAMLMVGLAALTTLGCAGPRLGSGLVGGMFGREASSVAEEAPHYVSGQMPLPSQQAARPASVEMPAGGQYDAQALRDVRSRRSGGYLGSSSRGGSNCFS